jgi:hypothetical protein
LNFRQLTPEELEPLAHEFALFLSANGVDADYWQKLKDNNNEAVIHFIKQFSDSVWFKIFSNKRYIDFEDDDFYYYMDFLPEVCIILKKTKIIEKEELTLSMLEKRYEKTREEDMYQWHHQGAQFSDGYAYKKVCLMWASSKV